jgi:hypothetical protein
MSVNHGPSFVEVRCREDEDRFELAHVDRPERLQSVTAERHRGRVGFDEIC